MTATVLDWRPRARRLADSLAAENVLDDPMWRTAVENVPRHVFVPRFHRQGPGGTWTETTSADPGWLDAVYANVPLVTALTTTPGGGTVIVSSSTKPGLMVRMLAALDLQDGHRVLEIGTGTGYNAGLLAHRLGDPHIFSVDIDPHLVDEARHHLTSLGHGPTLTAGDGAAGLPDHAPYDRIIATCSVPAVPWAWAEQLRDGGSVLVDIKRGAHAGNLVHLHWDGDRLQGRFLTRWAAFMALRSAVTHERPGWSVADVDLDAARPTTTTLDPAPWTAPVPWFLATSDLR